jgi:peptidoglycan-associated lipoprotein
MYLRKFWIYSLAAVFAFAALSCAKRKTVELPPEEPVVVETTPKPEPKPQPKEPEVKPEMMPAVEDVFFDFDKYSLTDQSKRDLEKNARQLKDSPSYNITIEGHCDERGTNAYNMALGERRAKAAKDYLVLLGVEGNRFTTISYGEERPFDNGRGEKAWAKNRRAHFVVKK